MARKGSSAIEGLVTTPSRRQAPAGLRWVVGVPVGIVWGIGGRVVG